MKNGCSGIEKNILEPEHPLRSSSSDVMTNIAAHTFSSEVLQIILKLEICENQFLLPL